MKTIITIIDDGDLKPKIIVRNDTYDKTIQYMKNSLIFWLNRINGTDIDNDWFDILLEKVIINNGFTYISNDIRISSIFVDKWTYVDCTEKKIFGVDLYDYIQKNLSQVEIKN